MVGLSASYGFDFVSIFTNSPWTTLQMSFEVVSLQGT